MGSDTRNSRGFYRRTALVFAVWLATFACGGGILADEAEQPLTKREAQALVEESLEADTSPARRRVIRERLQENPQLAHASLRRAARDKETVGRAVELALALRLPGLFRYAGSHLDGDDEEAIIEYGLALNEDGAAEAVWKRWEETDRREASWGIANEALKKHPVPVPVLTRVKAFMDDTDDDVLRRRAGAILRFQLGVPGATSEEIEKEWRALNSNLGADSRAFRLAGTDLMASPYVVKGSAIPVGGNRRMKPGARIKFQPTDEWNDNSFTIKVRIRVVEDCEVEVALGAEHGVWKPRFKDGEWLIDSRDGRQWAAPGKLGEWVVVTFSVRKETGWAGDGAELRKTRKCRVTVGDAVLVDNGWLNGDLTRLEVTVAQGESGTCAVGGAEFIRQ